MSKSKKIIVIIIDLFFIITISPIIIYSLREKGINLLRVPYLEEVFPTYLLLGSTILISSLLVLLIASIFYPINYTGILFKEKSGELLLKKSALEGLVREILIEKEYVKNSKVKIILDRKKIKIGIKGEVIPRVQILQKTIFIENEIKSGLEEFLGVQNSIFVKIKVNLIAPKSGKGARVL